eukprot:scaffold5678_cov134-Skeletonema_menzelii.AAC.5
MEAKGTCPLKSRVPFKSFHPASLCVVRGRPPASTQHASPPPPIFFAHCKSTNPAASSYGSSEGIATNSQYSPYQPTNP